MDFVEMWQGQSGDWYALVKNSAQDQMLGAKEYQIFVEQRAWQNCAPYSTLPEPKGFNTTEAARIFLQDGLNCGVRLKPAEFAWWTRLGFQYEL